MSKKKLIDWDSYVDTDGVGHVTEVYDDGTVKEHLTTDYEEIYGEPDPNPTGEYYDEWMPRYGGHQPDDND